MSSWGRAHCNCWKRMAGQCWWVEFLHPQSVTTKVGCLTSRVAQRCWMAVSWSSKMKGTWSNVNHAPRVHLKKKPQGKAIHRGELLLLSSEILSFNQNLRYLRFFISYRNQNQKWRSVKTWHKRRNSDGAALETSIYSTILRLRLSYWIISAINVF